MTLTISFVINSKSKITKRPKYIKNSIQIEFFVSDKLKAIFIILFDIALKIY